MERSPDRAPRVWLRHVEDADLGVFLTQESDPESAAVAGVATRALALMLEEVTARPVHAHVVAHNLGSIRVLEKCGFRRVEDHVAPEPDDGLEELLFVLD